MYYEATTNDRLREYYAGFIFCSTGALAILFNGPPKSEACWPLGRRTYVRSFLLTA